jgi:hypothetical protein
MDDVTLLALGGAAVIGLVAALSLMRRDLRVEAPAAGVEGHFAVSTEGMKRCPYCAMGNLVSDATCSACGKRLA